MTWLTDHLIGLIWTACALGLLTLSAAGSLWRWLHPNATQEQDAR